MPNVTIDGRNYTAPENATIMTVARAHGIRIPALCFHPALKPGGACRLCAVEVIGRADRPAVMLACLLRIKAGMVVKTTGDRVMQARTEAFERLIRMAPHSVRIRELAAESGVRLEPPPDDCIRCRLCIRVCKEVVGAGALSMKRVNHKLFVVPEPGRCIGCGTCANLCPTHAIRVRDKENVRTISIRDEVIGQHPLERCEGCGKAYATVNFIALIGPPTHRYAPPRQSGAPLLSHLCQAFLRPDDRHQGENASPAYERSLTVRCLKNRHLPADIEAVDLMDEMDRIGSLDATFQSTMSTASTPSISISATRRTIRPDKNKKARRPVAKRSVRF